MNRFCVCVFIIVLSGMMFIYSDVYAMIIQFDSIERLQKQDTQITLSMSAIQIEGIKGLSKVENDALCAVKLQEICNVIQDVQLFVLQRKEIRNYKIGERR